MVEECRANNQLLERVSEIYDWLDLQIRKSGDCGRACEACGRCCDFAEFEHRLFVTTAELMYLAAKLGSENIKPMTASRCPYNTDGKCTIYEYRFAACRIFYCKGDTDFQSKLSESALNKFKSICTDFQIPYRYTDLAAALNNAAANTYRPAGGYRPADRID
jgi:Fe-S-cluster containining protein